MENQSTSGYLLLTAVHPRGVSVDYCKKELNDSQREFKKKSLSKTSKNSSKKHVDAQFLGRVMSNKTANRIANIASWLMHTYKETVFFTVTLPKSKFIDEKGKEIFQSDEFYLHALMGIIENFSRTAGNERLQYLCVCERQTKYDRGAIHFHLVINQRVNKDWWLPRWLSAISEFHYESINCLDFEKVKVSRSGKLGKYLSKTKLGNYLVKSKKVSEDKRDRFFCRQYTASQLASKFSEATKFYTSETCHIQKNKTFTSDYCTINLISEKVAVEICNSQ